MQSLLLRQFPLNQSGSVMGESLSQGEWEHPGEVSNKLGKCPEIDEYISGLKQPHFIMTLHYVTPLIVYFPSVLLQTEANSTCYLYLKCAENDAKKLN